MAAIPYALLLVNDLAELLLLAAVVAASFAAWRLDGRAVGRRRIGAF